VKPNWMAARISTRASRRVASHETGDRSRTSVESVWSSSSRSSGVSQVASCGPIGEPAQR